MAFRFRLIARDDFALLHRWLNLPHVAEWWGDGPSMEQVAHEYGAYIDGTDPIHAYIALDDDTPFAHVQWMRYADYPSYARILHVDDRTSANCDVFIGEPTFLHRGIGAPLLRAFVHDVIFADVRVATCFIDPAQENRAAIRAYEKAGFRFVRDIDDDGEGGTVHLMEMTRT